MHPSFSLDVTTDIAVPQTKEMPQIDALSSIELHHLDLLKVERKGKTVKIIDTVASKWDRVALRLHFSGSDISRIERDHHQMCSQACRTMFGEWLEGKGRKPITWDTLLTALIEAEFSELASNVETIIALMHNGGKHL